MRDSILVTLLLNEGGAFKNITLFVYVLYAILASLFALHFNLFAAIVYTAVSLELVFTFIEIIVDASIQWAVRHRNPTMTAV